MKTVLASALLLLITSTAGAAGMSVTYEVNGNPYEGYYVSPSAKAPLVVIIHDWDGLTDYEITRANMLAERGYAAFAADLFGAGVRPATTEERRRLTGEIGSDSARMRALVQGALDAARSKGANVQNAVLMGYCFGGAPVLDFARSGANLKGFVTFHGRLKTPEGQDYSKAGGHVLVFHGTADTSITMDQFAQLARELEADGVMHEMTTYSGAPHAFTVFGTDRYREDADKKSWRRFIEFLAEVTD